MTLSDAFAPASQRLRVLLKVQAGGCGPSMPSLL
eukprot:CAMPEP_0118957034 /NCGR_PEP_ID=MMETSP1169-20130426/61891_1 /TAXON_ID=36882 /ORGANISM="Pyramimonas obovata, Strain CCMP722" /LENGTH=33 /DNA_ID= /DNA_START= /DNA_END= /DNA_ORIENTATION=